MRSLVLRPPAQAPVAAAPHAPGSVEAHLSDVLASLQAADLDRAHEAARRLTERYPTHPLSQLMLSDVSRMQSFELPLLATGGDRVPVEQSRRLEEMRIEAQRRLSMSPADRSDRVRLVPVWAWTERRPYLVVVDARLSRLYLLKAQPASDTRRPVFEVVERLYVSFGKNGLDKRLEGDGRTPLGLYRIVGRRTDAELPPLYGHGALTLNYPNAVDAMQGRTGSGIWLHGVPPGQYVRPPFSSDGCIVLANPDFQRLFDPLDLRGASVLVAQDGLWAEAGGSDGAPPTPDAGSLAQAVQALQTARTAHDPMALQGWMHPTSREAWARLRAAGGVQLGHDGLSLLADPQHPQHVLAEFHETVNGQRTEVVRAQHWWREAVGWRLLRDEVVAGKPSAALAYVPSPPRGVGAEGDAMPEAVPPALRQAVEAWASAWSRGDMEGYLQAYAPSFKPQNGQTRAAWAQERRERIVGRASIDVRLSQLQFDVDGPRAVVRFRQDYRSGPIVSNTHKRLELVLEQGRWRIVSEKAGR
ncbi:nuclear transport factor 2 family protein [Aquabacterium sp. A08]|uniref:L,D-transpeptidase family protein n=1 Tax=Aquabacterium sp. A08 TaxID=2718532 RepID=UPI001AAEAA9B